MNGDRPDLQRINAYIDGELSSAEAAEVAGALALDRALAERVATLSHLKATIQASLETPDVELHGGGAPHGSHLRYAMAMVACAAVLLLVVFGATMAPWWPGRHAPTALTRAWELHAAWTRESDAAAPRSPAGGAVLAALEAVGPHVYLPDLTAARLTLDSLRVVRLDDGTKALHAGYLGTRGCRISLVVIQGANDLPGELTEFERAAGQSYVWRSGGHGYFLLAEGMDPGRFAVIADSVYRASQEMNPFDSETRTALRESRERSAPCHA